ncbi:RNase P modulator RnpM [Spiroplasma endosymbiont of Labia minor]|uniref:RNase P modulator RnpM n=1 Tax=Spiroplasma endosymbiont of Labia minor TaxID=3066305 RepID=UPI0030CA9411
MNKIQKTVTLRKDIASGEMTHKKELIRIVKQNDGTIFIDQTKKANGRGAYLKANLDALAKIKKTNALEKALKTKILDEVYQAIELEIKENWD